MTTWRGWVMIALLLALAFTAVYRWGPTETGPESRLAATTTAAPAPEVSTSIRTGPGPYTAAQTAVRTPLPTTTAPLSGFEGLYACRFATAGRSTPCCPDATATLALFWSGPDLAVADYIVGRESGCRAGIVNGSGCVGWFQLCGWDCSGSCRDGYANAEKAHDLWVERGWCKDWYLRGDPVTGATCA